MIFNVKCIKIAFLLCFVCSVASYPKPKVDNADIDATKGNEQIDRSSAGDNDQYTKSKDNDKHLRKDGIAGSIEINDENIEGHLHLNDNIMNQRDAEIEHSNNEQPIELPDDIINKQITGAKNGGVLTGKIVMNDDNIEGEIHLPSDLSGNDDYLNPNDDGTIPGQIIAPKFDINLTESDERQNVDADTISGNIKMDDDGNIEGTINLPDNDENAQPDAGTGNEGQSVGDEAIAGSIEIKDDGNIEGTINVPDNGGNGQLDAGNDNEGQSVGDEAIAGSIEINDDGNIEGTINVPDDGGNGQLDAGNDNEVQSVADEAIAGSIEINDDGDIEGTINVPDDGGNGQLDKGTGNQPDAGKYNEGQDEDQNAFTGSIEMNADGIIGKISLPNELENVSDEQPNAKNDDITGEVVIDDQENIEGYIAIADGGENSNAATVDIDDGSTYKDLQTQPKDSQSQSKDEKNCWLNLHSKLYLDALDEIDAKYSKARRQYQDNIGPDFNKKMMEVLLSSQGKAPRAIHQANGNPNVIPAGLNLGGFGMMRMPGSMLFFHRMKLRNSTVFRVDFLEANLMDMSLVARLSLNDLHLQGSYERATTAEDMAILYFIPTYGELDVLLKSVNFKMEGRLRMLNNRLMIEIVNSDILTREILLSYANSSALANDIALDSIEDFVGRLKCDLNFWLKDYFNDYLMYFGIVGGGKNSEIQLYEKQKTIKANEYADHALKGIKKKLRNLNSANVKLPSFTLKSVINHKIELKNGVLRGLDSMYRRSVATTKKNKSIRTLDIMMGFSNLKVEYQYEASIIQGMPPLTGLLILTADELVAHLEISQVDDSQTVDMNVDSIVQIKPESLTVEGPANRLIADFKYILENPIIAIMTNVMKHNIKMLKTLTRCEPQLWGENREHYPYANENDDPYIPLDKKESKIDEVYNKDEEKKKYDKVEEVDAFDDEKDKAVKPANKEWSDYTFSKNDSVEIEVPINGQLQKMKLNRNLQISFSRDSVKFGSDRIIKADEVANGNAEEDNSEKEEAQERAAQEGEVQEEVAHEEEAHEEDVHNGDAHDEDAHNEDAHDEDAHDEDAHDEYAHDEYAHDEDAHDEDAHDDDAHNEEAHDENAHDYDAHNDDAHEEEVHEEEAHEEEAHDEDVHDEDAHDEDAHDEDAHYEDAHDEDAHDENAHDEDAHVEDAHYEDAHDEDAHDEDAHNDDTHDENAHDEDAHDEDAHDEDVHDEESHNEDAHDDDAHDEDAHDEDAHDEDAHGDDAHEEDAHDEYAHDEDAHDEGAHDEESHDKESHDKESHDKESHDEESHDEESHDEDAHDEGSNDEDAHEEDAHDEDAHDEESHDKESHDKESHDEESHDEESHDEDAHDEDAHEDDAYYEDAHDEDAHDKDAHDEDAHDEDAHDEDAHDEDAHDEESPDEESHDKDAHDEESNDEDAHEEDAHDEEAQ